MYNQLIVGNLKSKRKNDLKYQVEKEEEHG